jgi:hypothetical protein
MNKIKWKDTWNERRIQILHELYRVNFSVWEDALSRCGGWNMDSAGYIIDNYIRFNGVLNGYSNKRDSLRSMIIKHFVEVRKGDNSRRRTCPPIRGINQHHIIDASDTFWEVRLKDELSIVDMHNKGLWERYSKMYLDETDTAISIIKNIARLNEIYSQLCGSQRQDAIDVVIGFFVHPDMRLPGYVAKIKDDMIWEKKVRDINDALVEMHNGDKGIWSRYSYGNILCKDSAIKIIGDYTKLCSLTDSLDGDKRKKIVKMVIEFFTDETRETKMNGLDEGEWERRKFDVGLAVELIDKEVWENALIEGGMERSAAAELLIEDNSELSALTALTDRLSECQMDQIDSIIVDHFTENINYCTWERRKAEVLRALRKLADNDSNLWENTLEKEDGVKVAAADEIMDSSDSINSLTDNLTNGQWEELEKLVIDYFTVHHIAEPKHKVGVFSDHLRVDLVRVLESNDSLFAAAWNMGLDSSDAPYDVASKILIKYSSTSYIYSKILDEGEVSEAIDFIIDYYTKGKGEEMHTGVFSDHLRVDLVRILEKHSRFNDAWKEGIEKGDTPYDVASRILATYTETDGICTKITIQGEVSEAKYFIIQYYTKGKGEEMPKKVKKVKLLPDDAKELKRILDRDDFDIIWKDKIKAGNDPEAVANNILNSYNSTNSFFQNLDSEKVPAAVAFVINYFTKGEGVMSKIKDAVQDTKDETIKAGAIALKITSGNIAIKNIKKIMVSTFGMKDDAKKKFMESAIADVGIAQVGSFLMSLPQNDSKTAESMKIVRECIILASTQKAFESLDVDKYVDKMMKGIDLPSLKKLGKNDSVADK